MSISLHPVGGPDPQVFLREAVWLLDHPTEPPTRLLLDYAEEHKLLSYSESNLCWNTAASPALRRRGPTRKHVQISAKLLFHIFGPIVGSVRRCEAVATAVVPRASP